MTVNDKKFKKNFTGILGVNCESFIMNTPNTRSFQMGLIFTNTRKTISDNKQTIKILNEVLNNLNLTTKHVKTTLKQKRQQKEKLSKPLTIKCTMKQNHTIILLKIVKTILND